ncbi:MAG: hypothetical protein ACR2JW_03945 [Thermomicrobiales bacterium]
MTIALFPHRADAIGRFARFSSVAREAGRRRTMPEPDAMPAINEGRWATLPGEYTGPRSRPLDRALPAIKTPGVSEPVACAGYGPVTLHLAGAWVGRVAFEGSADGVTWSRLPLTALDGGTNGAETDHPGLWRTPPDQSIAWLRLRVTRLTTGTVLVAIAGSSAIYRTAHEALDSAA